MAKTNVFQQKYASVVDPNLKKNTTKLLAHITKYHDSIGEIIHSPFPNDRLYYPDENRELKDNKGYDQ